MEYVFHFSALIVLPFWIAMIFFPNKELTKKLVGPVWIALPPALCYLAFALPNFSEFMSVFAAPSPQLLASVMAKPWAASMFWAYAGAFDLFVGRWIYFDSQQKKINPWPISVILLICIFIGPLAFVLYAALVKVRDTFSDTFSERRT